MAVRKITIPELIERKRESRKITMLTAYDFPVARLLDEAGVDVVLVGDSLGNVVLGYENTLPVTMEEMLHHTKAVCRGAKRALAVADMPFMSYQTGVRDGVVNAGRFIKEGGARAVKLEGGGPSIVKTVSALVEVGIPVIGHLGLTPQFIHQLGGFRVQGKDRAGEERLTEQALCLQEAGAFALILECVPPPLSQKITSLLNIPTIGIGAGPACDGQVLVTHDLLGLLEGKPAKFVKRYASLREESLRAVHRFMSEVEAGEYPGPEHCYTTSR